MIHVVFVCLGNICRSPMAEGLFRSKVEAANLADKITVSSAATGSWNLGNPPHRGTQQVLKKHGIDCRNMRATLLNAQDFSQADYIIAMDDNNIADIRQMNVNNDTPKIAKLLDFVADEPQSTVPDPYYTGDFNETERLVDAGTTALLRAIKSDLYIC